MADLHVHTLVVRDHRISCCDRDMVQHGMGHDAISLDLDAEWDGLTVTIVVGECDAAYDAVWHGDPWVLPAVSLFEAGWLPVTVVGRDDSGTVRVVTERCDYLLRVVPSGCVDGSVPPEDAPDILNELLGAADDAREAAEAAGERVLYAYPDPEADDRIILQYPSFLESEDGGSVYLNVEEAANG